MSASNALRKAVYGVVFQDVLRHVNELNLPQPEREMLIRVIVDVEG